MFSLVTTYFKSDNPIRQSEIDKALANNLSNPFISEVVLYAEATPPIHHKIRIIRSRRPTFGEMFATKVTGILVVANSDIYFNDTLALAKNIQEYECYALSRWDDRGGKLVPYHSPDSQDVWIFSKPPVGIGGYHIGMPGCDNRLIHEIKELGYTVTNPCLSIQAVHLHVSGYRTYSQKDTVHGQYGYVHATSL